MFLVNVPLGLGAAALALRLPLTAGNGEKMSFDTHGLVLFAAFITSSLIMLEETQQLLAGAWLRPAILFALAVAAGMLLLLRREKRAASPLLPLALLKRPAIWRCDALAACHGAMLVSLITFLPLYLGMVHATSASRTGLLILPLTAGLGLGSLATGRIVSRTGKRRSSRPAD